MGTGSQAGSQLSAQSQTWDSNSRTLVHDLSQSRTLNRLSPPGTLWGNISWQNWGNKLMAPSLSTDEVLTEQGCTHSFTSHPQWLSRSFGRSTACPAHREENLFCLVPESAGGRATGSPLGKESGNICQNCKTGDTWAAQSTKRGALDVSSGHDLMISWSPTKCGARLGFSPFLSAPPLLRHTPASSLKTLKNPKNKKTLQMHSFTHFYQVRFWILTRRSPPPPVRETNLV